MSETRFADGSEVLIGARVQRCHPQDGSPRAGKRRGPLLRITKLVDYTAKDGSVTPKALATLKELKSNLPRGTEPVWNLRRAPGHQPKRAGEPDMRSQPRRSLKGDPSDRSMKGLVSSIRIGNDLKERVIKRGDELSAIMRRDLIRLYDLLDEARDRLVFPAGTLGVLAEAWSLAAPPPTHGPLRPQWFVPVLRNACDRIATEPASRLSQYADSWTPLDALAVLDIVERFEPESSGEDRLRLLGLRECPPDEQSGAEMHVRARSKP